MHELANQSPVFQFIPWVILFPLIGLLLNLIFGKHFKEKLIGWIASIAVVLSFVVSLVIALNAGHLEEPVRIMVAEWISIGNFDISWICRIDSLSLVMMLVVSGVGALIHIYAIGYMHDDVRHNGDPSRYQRFFIFFNLFIVAMMILVTADNYLMMFVGWEGVGLCSYLLIGFWYDKGKDGIANAQAGKKAFIVNRIGDFGLLIALFILFGAFGSLQFDAVFEKAPEIAAGVIMAVTLFMLLGVTGKSAQLPLYVWLPDAMAGPTPVSALIHAATMVTAGVYLIARSSPLFSMVPDAQNVVVWVGSLTAFFAATIAVGQFDIKKVLAYSTISQLGFMVAAVGMGAYVAGMFHLVTHAFFKALLFLSSGSVIQGVERGMHNAGEDAPHIDPQDMRNMGGLQRKMPVTHMVFLTGALALAGIVPLAGFFSKDEILAAASSTSMVIYALLAAAAFLTAFYMGRQLLMVFYGKPRTEAARLASESPPLMTVPLMILAGLSLLGGLLNLPGLHWMGHWLESSIAHPLETGFIWSVAIFSTIVAVAGLIIAWLIYGRVSLGKPEKPDPLQESMGGLFTALNRKWWVDELYHTIIVRPYRFLSEEFFGKWFDVEVIDGAVNDVGSITNFLSRTFGKLQTGYVRTYSLSILFGVVLIIVYLVLR